MGGAGGGGAGGRMKRMKYSVTRPPASAMTLHEEAASRSAPDLCLKGAFAWEKIGYTPAEDGSESCHLVGTRGFGERMEVDAIEWMNAYMDTPLNE